MWDSRVRIRELAISYCDFYILNFTFFKKPLTIPPMPSNQDLIHTFYAAFDQRDFKTMQSLYADHATFSDPVFTQLDSAGVKAMWEMLLTSAKDLKVSVGNVTANEAGGACTWEAFYTFSTTGRKVHNIIQAQFTFANGKIVKHVDRFDFYRWSRMAFGATGVLLGWTSFFQRKVQATANGKLRKFMLKG